jgi:hypothetical protein
MDLSQLNRISETEWQIPATGRMRVPGTIFADETLIRAMDDKVREQVSNVASLPGVVKASFALPDAHWATASRSAAWRRSNRTKAASSRRVGSASTSPAAYAPC